MVSYVNIIIPCGHRVVVLNIKYARLSSLSKSLLKCWMLTQSRFYFRMMDNSSHCNFSSSTAPPSTNQMMMMNNYHVQLPTITGNKSNSNTNDYYPPLPLHLLLPLLVIIVALNIFQLTSFDGI
jgi:hypothetical protein